MQSTIASFLYRSHSLSLAFAPWIRLQIAVFPCNFDERDPSLRLLEKVANRAAFRIDLTEEDYTDLTYNQNSNLFKRYITVLSRRFAPLSPKGESFLSRGVSTDDNKTKNKYTKKHRFWRCLSGMWQRPILPTEEPNG